MGLESGTIQAQGDAGGQAGRWRLFGLSPAGFVWATLGTMLALHGLVWGWVVHSRRIPWTVLLSHWDSGWYRSIAESGYTGQSAAFYPLYPLVAGLVARGTGLPTVVAGALLSLACLLGFTACVAARVRAREAVPAHAAEGPASILLPATPLAWVALVFSPASYAFHSLHTESLFLGLSFLALWAAAARRPVLAAGLGGLSALTRNQGVFVAVAAALLVSRGEPNWRRRARRFVLCGAISAALYSAYPLYLAWTFGDPLVFLTAQSRWTHAQTWGDVGRCFLLLNPWQGVSVNNLLHHAFVLALLVAGVWVARRSWCVAVYCLGTVLLFPLQAEFASTFRYGAVLFPALFLLGDAMGRLPRWVRYGLLAGLVGLNLAVTRAYAIGRWAY